MTSAALQIIALISMLIDHIGVYLVGSKAIWMRAIGRMAVPIYAMGIVEGFIHTKSRGKYLLKLLICALIADIPHVLLTKSLGLPITHNAVFGFIIGVIALLCLEKKSFFLVFLPLLVALAEVLKIEYGWATVLLIVAFYLCRKYLKKRKVLYAVCLFVSLVATQFALAVVAKWWVQLFAIAAFIPLALYNGKKGHRLPKYIGYIFYPAHLLAIWLIRLLLH